MIAHLFKMVWNRRRANGLILIELLVSFLALTALLTVGCWFAHLWGQPLGYEPRNLWRLDVGYPDLTQLDDEGRRAVWAEMDQMALTLESVPEVEAFTPLEGNVPYGYSVSGFSQPVAGGQLFVRGNEVLPSAMETLRLRLVAGRWLREEDRAAGRKAVVITRDYARLLFGDGDPIGRTIEFGGVRADGERRVVGVLETWRQGGELDPPAPAQFSLVGWGPGNSPPRSFVVRVEDGVSGAIEEELLASIRRISPGWSINLSPLARHRSSKLREAWSGLAVGALVAVFLGVMVGLGLVGVLWQSVTRRTREIGLRRALGATAGGVRWQVLGELLALVTLAAGAGAFLFLQLPLLQITGDIPWGVHLAALALALAVTYGFVLLCGLYPGWLATRVKVAEALQHES